jgi:hypothetical protein
MRCADELTARLGAEVAMLAFSVAVERWMKAGDDGAGDRRRWPGIAAGGAA